MKEVEFRCEKELQDLTFLRVLTELLHPHRGLDLPMKAFVDPDGGSGPHQYSESVSEALGAEHESPKETQTDMFG